MATASLRLSEVEGFDSDKVSSGDHTSLLEAYPARGAQSQPLKFPKDGNSQSLTLNINEKMFTWLYHLKNKMTMNKYFVHHGTEIWS